jgi:polar amino acid transport system substrate-binding protein
MRKIATGLVVLVIAAVLLASTVAQAQESQLERVKQRGELIVGTKYDFPPMGFINKDTGQPDGFEVDLAKEIAKELGVKVKFVQALSKTRIPLIVNGNVDLIVATMTHKRDREGAIDFSIHYLITGQRPITRKETGITHVSQLAGKKVGAVQGGNAGPNLLKVQPKAEIVSFQEHTETLLALKQKKVDALVTDDVLIQWMAKQNPDLAIVGKLYTVEPYGMGVRQNDSKWRNAINHAFLEIWDSRRYHEIYHKWFGQAPEFEIPWYPK